MDEMIAYCRLDCGECETYIAIGKDDFKLRKKIAKKMV